jgi:hypothetical protein
MKFWLMPAISPQFENRPAFAFPAHSTAHLQTEERAI